MFLNIKGIGKIQDSSIEMNGITVVAGENNTGKSTFGKVLYSIFNACSNSQKKIYNMRASNIGRIFNTGLTLFDDFDNILPNKKVMDNILALNKSFSVDNFRKAIINSTDTISDKERTRFDEIIDKYLADIEQFVTVDDNDIQKTIINRHFRTEFMEQVNHLNRPEASGEIILTIKNKQLYMKIEQNECSEFSDDISLMHDAIYIDTPFIMDNVQLDYYNDMTPIPINHRTNLLHRLANETQSSVIEEVIIRQKMDRVLTSINTVTGGEFKNGRQTLQFVERGMHNPIALANVSAGIKTFLIIKRLLEAGEIKEYGVLIFDEPEIHLHPEWQIQFAEILVLLQKEFNLTILLTTHSPYFLNAIEVYGKKHGIYNRYNCYIAETWEDTADVREVTNNIDEIYKQLAGPFQKLENIGE
jgi:predicted ATP-dependent endonuclease of OLD family